MTTRTEQAPSPDTAPGLTPAPEARGLTLPSLIISLILTLLTGVWVRQSEIRVLATQVTESVPAIPALAALVVLVPLNLLLRRIAKHLPFVRPLAQAEVLTIFLFVAVASTMMGIGVVQFLLALISTAFYKTIAGAPELWPHFPKWLMPTDPDVLRQLFERAPDARIPWDHWLLPGLCWMGFFVVFAWTLYSLMRLFYEGWSEDERLSFPLVSLPLEMTENADAFYRNRLMWLGFALAAAYNGVNILHALVPSVPPIGKSWPLLPATIAAPWDALQPLALHLRPEIIGLGFQVSTEVSLTIWLGFLLIKLAAVTARGMGYEPNGLYTLEQGMGAYLVLAVTLAWAARKRIAAQSGTAWRLLGGVGLSGAFLIGAGIAPWVAGVFLALVLAVTLVYGRIRAQTGVPMVWLFPYQMPKDVMLYTLGGAAFAPAGPASAAAWTLFAFLSRGYFATAVAGYQIEGMEIARRERIPRRDILVTILTAVALGFAVGLYHHLESYYRFGALHLRGDIWGSSLATYEVQTALSILHSPAPPDLTRIAATGAGGVTAFLLSLLSLRFVGFPLNAIGYAMTCCFGGVLWFSFFFVWLVKVALLRYGGMRLYKQAVPLFTGLALGHFATAGIFWGLVGAFSGEAVQGYNVFFG
jgi:hypothetical protein